MIPTAVDSELIRALRSSLASHTNVRLAILFGSIARGDHRPESDIDIAVLAPGVDPLELGAELGRSCGREVNVVSLDRLGIPLLEEIVRDGLLIRERHAGEGATWRTRALIDLETDRPWYARMRDAWLRRVAEEGVGDG